MEYTPISMTVMLPPKIIRSPCMDSTPTAEDNSIQRPKTTSSSSAARSHRRRLDGPSNQKCPNSVLAKAAARPAATSDQMERVK
ncbi:hypothetical protein D3C76_1253210 [compost metagenome]